MVAAPSFATLVERRLWIYCGGLALILGIRTLAPPSTTRRLVASVLLGVMVLTYAGELWLGGDRRIARPALVVPGAAGIVGGVWLSLGGALVGLLFAGGGLLFLNQAMAGPRGESA